MKRRQVILFLMISLLSDFSLFSQIKIDTLYGDFILFEQKTLYSEDHFDESTFLLQVSEEDSFNFVQYFSLKNADSTFPNIKGIVFLDEHKEFLFRFNSPYRFLAPLFRISIDNFNDNKKIKESFSFAIMDQLIKNKTANLFITLSHVKCSVIVTPVEYFQGTDCCGEFKLENKIFFVPDNSTILKGYAPLHIIW